MTAELRPRLIAAPLVVAQARDLRPGYVEIERGRIVRVGAGRPRGADVVVRAGAVIPGLVDLQINGAAGVDFLECADDADLVRVGRHLLSTGVTAYLATLISAPPARLRRALSTWRRLRPPAAPRLLGLHLEGPYLNPEFAGAHRRRDLRAPDAAEFVSLLQAAGGLVRLVTLAPELPDARAVIRAARRRGVVVAAGHTAATYAQARAAFAAGVSMVTHLFNAMRGLHHREPGIAGAALADPRVTVGLIADFVHLHPAVVALAIAIKGHRKVALVTDAVAGRLGGRRLLRDSAPRLPGGVLAGSALTLDQAVRNVVSLGVPLRQAVLMASTVPAGVLRRRDLGRIAPGARADLVVLDRMHRVRQVYVNGVRVWSR